MINDSRKKRKLAPSPTIVDKKDEQVTSKVQKHSSHRDRKTQIIERSKERLLLARASVIKEKYRSLLLAYDPPWQDPPKVFPHWDCFLLEARWMWNDMAQERLWKKAVAHQLSNEAAEYRKNRLSKRDSSSSTDEVISVFKEEVFTLPIGRQLRTGLQEMVRKNAKKQNAKHEKLLRAFQQECESKELAAVYGFKTDDGFSFLDIKVPTLPCIVAPNEPEKDYLSLPSTKPSGLKKTAGRSRPKPGVTMVLNGDELGSGQFADSHHHGSTRKKQRFDRQSEICGPIRRGPNAHRGGRPRKDFMINGRGLGGSDLSLSQADLEGRQEPPTIDDFLARSEDQLLFVTANDLSSNWEIVTDVMASAGFFMSPKDCKERHDSIEMTIKRHQAQLMRPGEQGSMHDLLLRQLRTTDSKDNIRKKTPDQLASRYTQHTCTAHRKRIQKMKAISQEEGPPKYHISQRKLSESIMKTVGGRLVNPKDSWSRAQKQNVARLLARDYSNNQLAAAGIAARQNLNRVNTSQPTMNQAGGNFDGQKKITPVQQGTMQLTENLADSSAWCGAGNGSGGTPGGGFMGTSGLAAGGGPPPMPPPGSGGNGHLPGPWISPPQGLPHVPSNLMGGGPGKVQGQPSFAGGPLIPLKHGINVRNVMQQQLMGMQNNPDQQQPSQQQQSAQHPLTSRGGPRPGRPLPQSPHPAIIAQHHQQYAAQLLSNCQENPAMLQKYIQSDRIRPDVKMFLMQAMQDTKRLSSPTGNLQNSGLGPSPAGSMQKVMQSLLAPHAMTPSHGGRKTQSTSPNIGEQFTTSYNLASFPTPPLLDHPSQYHGSASNRPPPPNSVRECMDNTRQASRHFPQHPSFSGYDNSAGVGQLDGTALNLGGLQGNGNPDISPIPPSTMDLHHQDLSSNTVDVRHAIHGVPESAQVVENHRQGPNVPLPGGPFPESAQTHRSLPPRQFPPPHYGRGFSQRPYGP